MRMPAEPKSVRMRRLLALLPLLSEDRVPLASLAAATGVDVAGIAADLALLSMCGSDPADPTALVPVLVDGDRAVTFGALPSLETPVRLTRAEMEAVLCALEACGVDPTADVWRRLAAAAAAAAEPAALARTVSAAVAAGGTADSHARLTAAAAGRRVTRIVYARHGAGETEEREIEPWDLFMWRGAWYLRARDRARAGERTFRLDRIASFEVTGTVFERPDSVEAPKGAAPEPEGLPVAEIEFREDAFDLSEREWPGAVFSELADGRVRASFPYAGTEWIARQVASRLGEAVVIAPAEVRQAVARVARSELSGL